VVMSQIRRTARLQHVLCSATPLECAGCLVEYNRGTGQWTMYCNHQMPGVGAIWMAPALRVGIDKLRFVTQDIGGAFGNKICLHPQFVACCLLARKLKRPIQWTECGPISTPRTRTATSARSSTSRSR